MPQHAFFLLFLGSSTSGWLQASAYSDAVPDNMTDESPVLRADAPKPVAHSPVSGTSHAGMSVTGDAQIILDNGVVLDQPVASRDLDGDGDVDMHDFALVQACFHGIGDPVPPGCQIADFNLDGSVDASDLMLLMECMSGANVLARPDCRPEPPPPPPGMVMIPAGEYQMGDTFNEGDTWELPVHAVWVDKFYVGRFEVTNQEYAEALNWAWSQGGLITLFEDSVYQSGGGTIYLYCDTTASDPFSRITWDGSTFEVVSGYEDHPMVMVSWYGAVAYCNWRSSMEGRMPCYDLSTWACNFYANGYRLLTEAEWERAARGDVAGKRFPHGDTINHDHANYRANGSAFPYDTSPYTTYTYHPTFDTGNMPYTSPVGYFEPNGYSLHDMAGNVREWCNDWYSSTYYGSSPYNNPRGPSSGTYRVLRGGSWHYGASYCRAATRNWTRPGLRNSNIGFRCAAGT